MTRQELLKLISENNFEKLEDIILHGDDKIRLLALDVITTILEKYNHIKKIKN